MTTGYRPEMIQRAFVDFIGTRVQPFWSLTVPKLRLIARRALSDDLIALQFETNRAFKRQVFEVQNGWHGGQHINIFTPIDGIYYQRSYSLVGLADELLWWHEGDYNNQDNKTPNKDNDSRDRKRQRNTVTIAIKPQGLVSDYLTQHAPLGTIFDSSIPSGDFTLAQTNSFIKKRFINTLSVKNPSPLLFIAGGSGITPMLGLVQQALQAGHNVTLLHYNRAALLRNHWQQLAVIYPNFDYHLINTADPSTYLAGTRHVSALSLLALELPLINTPIFACGSPAMLAGLYRAAAEITLPNEPSLGEGSVSPESHAFNNHAFDSHSLKNNIIIERFGSNLSNFDSEQNAINAVNLESKTITLRARQRQFTTSSTLLLGAEQAGLRLPYGCRQGICQMCRCNKISGVVKNIQTGKLSNDGYESIQTCITVAMTDVILDV